MGAEGGARLIDSKALGFFLCCDVLKLMRPNFQGFFDNSLIACCIGMVELAHRAVISRETVRMMITIKARVVALDNLAHMNINRMVDAAEGVIFYLSVLHQHSALFLLPKESHFDFYFGLQAALH